MGRDLLMLVLLMGLLGVAGAIFTVMYETLSHRRKQSKYESLHRRMGLDPENTETPTSEDR